MGRKFSAVLNLVAWLTGVLVSLAVGFAMTDRTLVVSYVPEIVTVVAGWIVVITTLVSAVLALMKQ